MDMEARHEKIVMDILKKYPFTFYAFGSRARGTANKFSDLDLCFMDTIPLHIQSAIKEDFQESHLPFEVDLVDWNMCDESFRKTIEQELIAVQKI